MYSQIELEHMIFFSTMSNPELFLIKDDIQDLSNFEIVKRPTLEFQSGSTESLSSSFESHAPDKREENNDQEKEGEEHHQSRIVSKQSNSEASTPTPSLSDEEDGFRTPTSLDHKIPVTKQCPPAPRKNKPSLKRKAPYSHCNCRHPPDLSKEVELLFPTHHVPLSDHSHQSVKKVRREEPK